MIRVNMYDHCQPWLSAVAVQTNQLIKELPGFLTYVCTGRTYIERGWPCVLVDHLLWVIVSHSCTSLSTKGKFIL